MSHVSNVKWMAPLKYTNDLDTAKMMPTHSSLSPHKVLRPIQ